MGGDHKCSGGGSGGVTFGVGGAEQPPGRV